MARAADKAAKRAAQAVAKAMKASLESGRAYNRSFREGDINRRALSGLAGMVEQMKKGKKRRASKKVGSAAPAAVQRALADAFKAGKMAAAAGGKKRRRVGKRKAAAAPKKRRSTAGKSVTAKQVIAMAKKSTLQKWLCEGKVRSGCGAKGKVTSGSGRFTRVR